MLLGSGELGKEVAIEAQRHGIEVMVEDFSTSTTQSPN
jgi:formate-dependent phosphoribosylglycinamide formyltransferase (GAR transformylase)